MNRLELKEKRREARKRHVRKNLVGTTERPRMTVFKSNVNISVQIIDDSKGHTLVSVSTLEKELKDIGCNKAGASKLGKLVGERLKAAKIKSVVFDRNGYRYHGVIKALADGTREAGIDF
jgi:large subunit ribosomal protein L18